MPDMTADNMPIRAATPAETVERLTAENCFNRDNKLMAYPPWLSNGDIDQAIAAGLIYQVNYRGSTFGHTDIFKAME